MHTAVVRKNPVPCVNQANALPVTSVCDTSTVYGTPHQHTVRYGFGENNDSHDAAIDVTTLQNNNVMTTYCYDND